MRLPSCTPGSTKDDGAGLRSLLDDSVGPVVLVGHSFGGMVLTEAGAHPSVRRLVYLDALMLDVGDAVFTVTDGHFSEGFTACMHPDDDGFEFDTDELTAYFLGRGWSAVDAEEFVAGCSPQRASASVLEATQAAWRSVPSTFVSCSGSEMSRESHALFASRATDVVEMSGDHFPNWRRPGEVADIVARVADRRGARVEVRVLWRAAGGCLTITSVPLFMDRHDVPGASAEEIAAAHSQDVGIQSAHGVRYLTYWFEPDSGSVFCLAEGPSIEAVEQVHREAHGQMAGNIIEVEPGPVQAFFGSLPEHPLGTAYSESAVRAVLFTDICGSTEMTERLGDDRAMTLLHEHDAIVRDALARYDGREVKHTGDGIMASFSSVSGAVEAAIAMQRRLSERDEDPDARLDVRIGISAGEPVSDHDDLFGAAVQLAARLCSCSDPRSITVSVAVRELCVGKRFLFEPRGPMALKGFSEPTHVYEVDWR